MSEEATPPSGPELGRYPIAEPKKKRRFGAGLASDEDLKEVAGKATVSVNTGRATRRKNLTVSDDALPDPGTPDALPPKE